MNFTDNLVVYGYIFLWRQTNKSSMLSLWALFRKSTDREGFFPYLKMSFEYVNVCSSVVLQGRGPCMIRDQWKSIEWNCITLFWNPSAVGDANHRTVNQVYFNVLNPSFHAVLCEQCNLYFWKYVKSYDFCVCEIWKGGDQCNSFSEVYVLLTFGIIRNISPSQSPVTLWGKNTHNDYEITLIVDCPESPNVFSYGCTKITATRNHVLSGCSWAFQSKVTLH